MATEIVVPALGESVTTATVARWIKQQGETVAADEPLVELETDKVTVEVNAPSAGVLSSIAVPEGTEVEVGAVLGMVDGAAGAATASAKAGPARKPAAELKPAAPEPRPAANPPAGVNPPPRPLGPVSRPASAAPAHAPLPAAAKMIEENKVSAGDIGTGTGKDGRITKGDVLEFLNRPAPAPPPAPAARPPRQDEPREQRVRMTRLRRTIALRLKEAQNNAAMLTTFNEVDMSAIMALRSRIPRRVREEAQGRAPRLHERVRPRLLRGAEGIPRRQRRNRRRRHRLQEFRQHGHRGRRPFRPGRPRHPRRRPARFCRDRGRDRRFRQARP